MLSMMFSSDDWGSMRGRAAAFVDAEAGVFDGRERFLMTSLLSSMGRGVPCSLKYNPHALQSDRPASSRRHRGVVVVWQFMHSAGGAPPDEDSELCTSAGGAATIRFLSGRGRLCILQ